MILVVELSDYAVCVHDKNINKVDAELLAEEMAQETSAPVKWRLYNDRDQMLGQGAIPGERAKELVREPY